MEARKYSTGTKGRIKMHCDKCREFIHANSPSFGLANEFIASVDADGDERVWQRFQSPADILPELQEWLGVDVPKPSAEAAPRPLPGGIPAGVKVRQASGIVLEKERAALERTRVWLAAETFEGVAAAEAAELAVRRFFKELSGQEP